MAIFPQGLSHVDARCNAGERRVLHQLKRCLEDDYLVWSNVPIGPRARQPDFVVLSPRWGLLLLEVKDWKRSSFGDANRDRVELRTARGLVTEANPVRQARDYCLELVDLMQRDAELVQAGPPFRGKLLFPYGWGVVFSNLHRREVAGDPSFDEVFPPRSVLLRDELHESVTPEAFQQRLWGMFTVTYPYTLTLPQRDRVRWHLFPELRTRPEQIRLEIDKPDSPEAAPLQLPSLLEVMDLQQEQIARTLGSGHRVIHGVAGSGKTMILIYRAQHLAAAAQPGRPILVLCFNRSLADRMTALLRARGVDERVQVRTFHGWCGDLQRSYQIDVPHAVNANYAERTEALARAVERAVDTGLVPGGQYTAVLIDEAHDFEEAWLRIATRMVDPATNSLLVLYDDAQSIYQKQRRGFSLASVGIEARGRTSILRLNYRNTAEVLALAAHCAQALLAEATPASAGEGDEAVRVVAPTTAGRRGPMPVLIDARNARDEAQALAERFAEALAEGVPPEECAVLCRTRDAMAPIEAALRERGLPVQSMGAAATRHMDWQAPTVKVLTLHSAKGLEFRLVAVTGLQAMPHRGEALDDAVRLLYVGMTRSTHTLVLSTHGESPVVTRVRDSLSTVARQFAQG